MSPNQLNQQVDNAVPFMATLAPWLVIAVGIFLALLILRSFLRARRHPPVDTDLQQLLRQIAIATAPRAASGTVKRGRMDIDDLNAHLARHTPANVRQALHDMTVMNADRAAGLIPLRSTSFGQASDFDAKRYTRDIDALPEIIDVLAESNNVLKEAVNERNLARSHLAIMQEERNLLYAKLKAMLPENVAAIDREIAHIKKVNELREASGPAPETDAKLEKKNAELKGELKGRKEAAEEHREAMRNVVDLATRNNQRSNNQGGGNNNRNNRGGNGNPDQTGTGTGG